MKKPNYKIDEIVLVFIVVVIVMIVSVYDQNKSKTFEAEKITSLLLDEHVFSIANNGVVDKNKLQEIQNMDYEEFKNNLNAKKDFCVYIEDDKGNIILAKGSSKMTEDGVPCQE